jgi:hypothetical protein
VKRSASNSPDHPADTAVEALQASHTVILTGRAVIGRNGQERPLTVKLLDTGSQVSALQRRLGNIGGQDWAAEPTLTNESYTGLFFGLASGWSFCWCVAGCRLAGSVTSRTVFRCWSCRARGLSRCAATTSNFDLLGPGGFRWRRLPPW